ncbi:MAG TPA: outer membrane beta-barrel protein, partial [Chitinophagaceae bacterium]|nr:outer membrane beta-barrel protein [Chitinophagaceae bacterium]
MKKASLFVLSCIVAATIYSQETSKDSPKIVKEHYTVSGGILGAGNFSRFMPDGSVNYDFRAGWSAGGWLNLPVSKVFSIEPQVMYSSYSYRSNSTTALLLNDGRVNYVSIPLQLKFHLG